MTMLHRARAVALVAALAVVAASCGDGDDEGTPSSGTQVPPTDSASPTAGSGGATTAPDEPAGPPEAVAGTTAATLDTPIAMVVRPGDDRLWVAERAGLIRTLTVGTDGELTPAGEPVLDLTDQTTTESERGLLGIAFSDDGRHLYVSHTDAQGDSRLVAYDVGAPSEGSAPPLDPDGGVELFRVDQPYSNHNGGHIVLGPDGALWLGLGDGGSADDPDNRAQDPAVLLGKMLRFEVAGATGPVEPEIVVSGVRNPWRFAFDTDGSLWIADVGQNTTEEINRLPADAIVGSNLGWSGYEGSTPYLDGEGRRPEDPVMPVFEYGREGGNCSITGGFVYRGTAVEGLAGAFLFADLCAGDVRAVRVDDQGDLVAEYDLGVHVEQPISFAADADGEPYILSANGSVVRLQPAG